MAHRVIWSPAAIEDEEAIAAFIACAHLANANKFGHIRRVNALLGLFVPELVTPLQLLGGEDAEET